MPSPGRRPLAPGAQGAAARALATGTRARPIPGPVNVDGFTDHEHHDLAAAEAALRAEAATEGRFDRLLGEIRFPARITPTALA